MGTSKEILHIAKATLTKEADAIHGLIDQLNEDFVAAVEAIKSANGKLIISGIGKSAIIANKIVSSLNSTGTPSVFLHAADAIHGDLGIIQKDDVVLCISKSGTSPEIVALIPHIHQRGNLLIGMTANENSPLAKGATYVLKTQVESEADPNNLAPTTSTTAQLALGDALTVCLLHENKFQVEDFARHHPGGALGKQLTLTVNQIIPQDIQPLVKTNTSIAEVIHEITTQRLGATAVMEQDEIVGIITDGDLRRMLRNEMNLQQLAAKDIMTKSPISIEGSTLAVVALRLMKKKSISHLIVLDKEKKYTGILHLLDLINEGIQS